MKTKLYIFALLIVASSSFAQQNAQYSQYIFNQMVINPAYAGNKESWNINAMYSSQWTGLTGAPTTQTISADGEISEKIGIGFHLVNDQIGAQSQQGLFGSYAYKIKLNEKFKLALGLAVGASYFTLDGSKLTMENPDDPAISNRTETQLKFDSKSGIFLSSDKFYAGFSVSDLLSDVFKSNDLLVPNQARHYYLTSGYVVNLNKSFKFKPSFLIKEDFKAPTNIDVNAFFLYNDKFWLGASYRTGAKIFNTNKLDNSLKYKDALTFMADITISEKFRIGYAYTHSLSAFNELPGHEISVGYYFPQKPEKRMKYLKYF
jgi:type IX secretion system PorP/SprF family membrane protein